MQDTASGIMKRIEELAAERGVPVRAILVGSAARDTWLSGSHDLDIFLGMPTDCELGLALQIARDIATERTEKYAEHPYVHAIIEGFEVDLVPCYLVEDAGHLKSAVDRTPFHTRYVSERVHGLEDDVLLLKQFMKGVQVYGSELKTGGFSGYLTELLVLSYGSFEGVLSAASGWRPGISLDPMGHGSIGHDEPLVVIDPVDPRRNVAAALSLERMMLFSSAARSFLARPDIGFFFAQQEEALSDQELEQIIASRASMPILIDFAAPDVVEDVLYPQLRKAEASIRALLEKRGFSVLRSDVFAYRDRAVMLFEMQVWRLSRISLRIGPQVWQSEHVTRFLEAHPHPLSGPYIKGERVVVEEAREHDCAQDLLAAQIEKLALGRHLSGAIRRVHNIYAGPEILAVRDMEYRIFLSEYYLARHRIG